MSKIFGLFPILLGVAIICLGMKYYRDPLFLMMGGASIGIGIVLILEDM